ncbi:hypothetical protein TruAng_011634 [Truncatella angustata]|nr:hypothetical protein TruAng_011634 [Truncatella angustata]
MMDGFRLPYRSIETSTVVGPFFWWTYNEDNLDDKIMQFVFRKSDVTWNGISRGWEVILSYSFASRMTSGYVKGAKASEKKGDTKAVEIEEVMKQLRACANPASHPLLLPIIILTKELGAENDIRQRLAREEVRKLEKALAGRYGNKPSATEYSQPEDLTLDTIRGTLINCRGEILWKRPQAWQNPIQRAQKANTYFWDNLPRDEKTAGMRMVHRELTDRLDFMAAKLENLEHYVHVSLERLDAQREELQNIIAQVESRVNIDIASQQHVLANASKRENNSMKTLAILGSIFLPGTFISSMFSMPFFNFDSDMNGPVSNSLWIYFVILVPLTVLVVGIWWVMDRRQVTEFKEDIEAADKRLEDIEGRVIKRLREKTKTKIQTGLSMI